MLCENCFEERATEKHHLFENTKRNRALYGRLVDDPRNIQNLCYACHHGHRGKVKHQSEREFCEKLGVSMRSKTGKL